MASQPPPVQDCPFNYLVSDLKGENFYYSKFNCLVAIRSLVLPSLLFSYPIFNRIPFGTLGVCLNAFENLSMDKNINSSASENVEVCPMHISTRPFQIHAINFMCCLLKVNVYVSPPQQQHQKLDLFRDHF